MWGSPSSGKSMDKTRGSVVNHSKTRSQISGPRQRVAQHQRLRMEVYVFMQNSPGLGSPYALLSIWNIFSLQKLKMASLLFLKLSYCFSNGIGSHSCPSRILLARLFCQNLTLQAPFRVTQLSGALEVRMKNVGGSHSPPHHTQAEPTLRLHMKPGAISHVSHSTKQRLTAGKTKESTDRWLLATKRGSGKEKILANIRKKIISFSHWKTDWLFYGNVCYSSLLLTPYIAFWKFLQITQILFCFLVFVFTSFL